MSTEKDLFFWWEETNIGWLPVSADHRPTDKTTPPRRAFKHVRKVPTRMHALKLGDLAKLFPVDEPPLAEASGADA